MFGQVDLIKMLSLSLPFVSSCANGQFHVDFLKSVRGMAIVQDALRRMKKRFPSILWLFM